ncbi:MAG: hypothetical protein ACK4TG_03820, partial [Thermaurantiacus sp.]
MLGFTRRKLLERKIEKLKGQLEKAVAELAQARIELLRPPSANPVVPPAPDTLPEASKPESGQEERLPPQAIPQPAPPPGT